MNCIKICQLNNEELENFNNNFLEDNKYVFEGCWLRNQRPENAKKSGYIDETTVRRRYIHFFDTYTVITEKDKNYLALKDYYLYVTNTLPENEIKEYYEKIDWSLKLNGYQKQGDSFVKDNTEVIINLYDNHPKNKVKYPSNYKSCDVVIRSKNYEYKHIQERMWNLSTKMYRMPDKRENPTYINSVDEIIKYLPAQVEMGCGPSIQANIPPLHVMHEMYKVQNHISGKFYFGSEDTLITDILADEIGMRNFFAQEVVACIRANITEGYKDFGQIYHNGYFKGIVYNNNFDRIVRRLNIPEKILRIYDINTYLPDVEFDSEVKSLICMGCHADRRQIQRKAREKGLKIIFIDPEGFDENGKFVPYLIEGPKNGDLILKTTFENAMKQLKQKLNS